MHRVRIGSRGHRLRSSYLEAAAHYHGGKHGAAKAQGTNSGQTLHGSLSEAGPGGCRSGHPESLPVLRSLLPAQSAVSLQAL